LSRGFIVGEYRLLGDNVAGNTKVSPEQVQQIINQHQQVKDGIDGQISQIDAVVTGDLAVANSGAMVEAIKRVHDTWESTMRTVQADLQQMIETLTVSKNTLVQQDEESAAGINRGIS
jgi:uncharacterized protein YukE